MSILQRQKTDELSRVEIQKRGPLQRLQKVLTPLPNLFCFYIKNDFHQLAESQSHLSAGK
jgi:hypothetical protein